MRYSPGNAGPDVKLALLNSITKSFIVNLSVVPTTSWEDKRPTLQKVERALGGSGRLKSLNIGRYVLCCLSWLGKHVLTFSAN